MPDCVGPGTVTDVDVEDVAEVEEVDVEFVEADEIPTQYASPVQIFSQSLPTAGFQE